MSIPSTPTDGDRGPGDAAVEQAGQSDNGNAAAADAPYNPSIPPHWPAFNVPFDNPLTAGRVQLGKQLFFDNRLSRDDSVSCAKCHDPQKGWSDGLPRSKGIGGQVGSRNSPTLINVAYQNFFFWDGAESSLEQQVFGPIRNKAEMGMGSPDAAAKKLNQVPGYRRQFQQVFGTDVTADSLAKAIASFERTILSMQTPYDRLFILGERTALSEAAKRGHTLFVGKAHCAACHSGPNFSDGGFHNIGIGIDAEPFDAGREMQSGLQGARGSFKTPTLREIAHSGPYMHDGSLPTLEEVVDYYNKGGNQSDKAGKPNQFLDEEIFELNLAKGEKRDLVIFLKEGLSSPKLPLVERPRLPK